MTLYLAFLRLFLKKKYFLFWLGFCFLFVSDDCQSESSANFLIFIRHECVVASSSYFSVRISTHFALYRLFRRVCIFLLLLFSIVAASIDTYTNAPCFTSLQYLLNCRRHKIVLDHFCNSFVSIAVVVHCFDLFYLVFRLFCFLRFSFSSNCSHANNKVIEKHWVYQINVLVFNECDTHTYKNGRKK